MKSLYTYYLLPYLLGLAMTTAGQAQTISSAADTILPIGNANKAIMLAPDMRPNLLHLDFLLNTDLLIGIGFAYERSLWQLNEAFQLCAAASASTLGGDLSWGAAAPGPMYRIGPKLYRFNHKRTFFTLELQYMLFRAHEHVYTSGDPVTYNLHGVSGGVGIMVFKKKHPKRFWQLSLKRIFGYGPKVVEGDNGSYPNLDKYANLNTFEFSFGCGRNF
ncbi:MAG: hypothetical protein IPN76_32000 [Saprospiraceae bacterium]|nr:hypothetical protein [Saprospiraceae bacterium]